MFRCPWQKGNFYLQIESFVYFLECQSSLSVDSCICDLPIYPLYSHEPINITICLNINSHWFQFSGCSMTNKKNLLLKVGCWCDKFCLCNKAMRGSWDDIKQEIEKYSFVFLNKLLVEILVYNSARSQHCGIAS